MGFLAAYIKNDELNKTIMKKIIETEEKKQKPVILIVDDVPENVFLLAEALRETYQIKEAINGKMALEIVKQPPKPDLILLDIMMPGMDGYAVCKKLKSDKETKDIPVVFLTAKSSEQDQEHGLSLGAIDYIVKPFSIRIVRSRVNNFVQNKLDNEQLIQSILAKQNATPKDSVQQHNSQEDLRNIKLIIDLDEKCLYVNKEKINLSAKTIAFYAWIASHTAAQTPITCPPDGAPSIDYATEFLQIYRNIVGEYGADDRTISALKYGMDKQYFLSNKGRTNKDIYKASSSHIASHIEIKCGGKRPQSIFIIDINPLQIEIRHEPSRDKLFLSL